MKRSGFKKPSYTEILAKKKEKAAKATKVPKSPKNASKGKIDGNKRKKKTDRQKLEVKLWAECKRITRSRHGNTCYTCGAKGLEGTNWQTGHGKPKGALPIRYKYDLRNLRPQCHRDNIHLGGLSDIFIAKLEQEKEGLEFLQESCRKVDGVWYIKKEDTLGGIAATIFLQNLLEQYKKL